MKIVISSGHGKYVRGATGYIDEVDEARLVVERVADILREAEIEVITFHDNQSTSQSENLNRIVEFHNDQGPHDLDISVHFNAYQTTSKEMGTECLYVTQEELAGNVSAAIADATDLPDRGAKYRSDLAFLNGTNEPSILIETVFVDSSADAHAYQANFEEICRQIASAVADEEMPITPPDQPERPEDLPPLTQFSGKVSWFGGPDDEGVSPSEGLAFIYEYEERPDLFLDQQPPGTTGLARRLDPEVYYVACRWDYAVTPKTMLADESLQALVRAGDKEFLAWPADWGPHEDTDRVADISPGLMEALGVGTDDTVTVIYPAPELPERPDRPERPDEVPTVTITIDPPESVHVTIVGNAKRNWPRHLRRRRRE